MHTQLTILLIILLIVSVIHQKFEKKKDRIIKEELRETLKFTEKKHEELEETLKFTEQKHEELEETLKFKERRYKASMEFNSYFLTNFGNISSVAIGVDSKHYYLYNEGGQAVIEESKREFSDPEKIFFALKLSKEETNIN